MKHLMMIHHHLMHFLIAKTQWVISVEIC